VAEAERSRELEVSRVKAQLRLIEASNASFTDSNAHKDKEIAELSAIIDDLLRQMGVQKN
jgi:hypothetical protein